MSLHITKEKYLSCEDIAIGAGSLWFESRVGQIEHSVANGSPPLRCFFRAVLPRHLVAEMGPATRYTLRRNNVSIMINEALFFNLKDKCMKCILA